jgi:rhamnose transport system permease protein
VRWRLFLGDLAGTREAVTFGMLAIGFTIFSLASPYFLGGVNFSFILTNSVEIGLIALTMTVVMVMGEIDLSVGSTVGLAAAMLGAMATHGVPFGLAIVIALATGLVAGFVNAALCIRFALPSVVITLGTLALYRGIAELIIGGNTVSSFPTWFTGWNTKYAFGQITYPQIFWLVSILVAIVVLHRLRFGRQVSFIGSNPRAAVYAGIRVNRAKVIAFAASGLISALAALILVSRLQSVDNTAGTGFELIVITAVLLGGTDFRGGRGTIIGTALAVLLVGVVENGLELLGVSAQVTTAVIGGLLILSILVDLVTDAAQTRRRGAQRADLPGKGGDAPNIQVAGGHTPSAPHSRQETTH